MINHHLTLHTDICLFSIWWGVIFELGICMFKKFITWNRLADACFFLLFKHVNNLSWGEGMVIASIAKNKE